MIKPTVFCDVCGVEKKDVNHWWLLSVDDSGWHKDGSDFAGSSILITEWSDTACHFDNIKHLCGATCVHAKVNEFLEKAQ